MLGQDIITGARFMGIFLPFVFALMIIFINRGKTKSKVYEKARYMVSIATMLCGIHFLVQFLGHFREKSVCTAWAINLAATSVVVALFVISGLYLLRDGHKMKTILISAMLFVFAEYALLGIGLLTGTLVNDEHPIRTTTFAVAVLITLGFIYMIALLQIELKKSLEKLEDSDLGEYHKYFRNLAYSTYILSILQLGTPWIGITANPYINAVYLILLVMAVCCTIGCFLFYGINMEAVINVQDEITEATVDEDDLSLTAISSGEMEEIGRKVGDWVSKEYYLSQSLNLATALKQMGLTSNQLNDYINSSTKAEGYRKWIIGLRIEASMKMMLEHPEYTLESIAEMCGYSDRSNFTRAFKSHVGASPSNWLAEQKK